MITLDAASELIKSQCDAIFSIRLPYNTSLYKLGYCLPDCYNVKDITEHFRQQRLFAWGMVLALKNTSQIDTTTELELMTKFVLKRPANTYHPC
jgi:hypothetical protein